MPASIASLMRNTKNRPAFLAFTSVAGIIVVLCLAFNPVFETHDDAIMSMIAHGYGVAAYDSPLLVYSNVLWGYLVRTIPTINGVLGYSLATLVTLLVVGWAILYFLLRLGAGYLTGLLAVSLIIARPTLFPQFTMNAGLLTVAAIIGWQVYARLGGGGNLVAACLLAFFGYLIRLEEFFLVLGVALPLLPWRALRNKRQMQVAFLLLGVAIASAAVFNRWSYSGPEWQPYFESAKATNLFVNYGMSVHLWLHPEIWIRHGYSQNDIALIGNWFFADPQSADPKSLNAMLAELGPPYMQEGSVKLGFDAFQLLTDPVLLPLFLSALLLLVLRPGRSVVFAWVLCLAALFTMGIIGRPNQLRVYVPLVGLLLVAPLVVEKCRKGVRQWIAAFALIAACVGNAYIFIPQALVSKRWVQQVQRDTHDLPPELIAVMSNHFPFTYAYPVLDTNPYFRTIRWYGLTNFTHAPFSVAVAEQKAGRGIVERLQTTAGIMIIASPKQVELLRIYCAERFNGQLHEAVAYQTSYLTVWQMSCGNSPGDSR